jgi:hypothetical protein
MADLVYYALHYLWNKRMNDIITKNNKVDPDHQ